MKIGWKYLARQMWSGQKSVQEGCSFLEVAYVDDPATCLQVLIPYDLIKQNYANKFATL